MTSVCLMQTENGNGQLPFVCCKQKMDTENFRLFAAYRNGKRTFVFLGWQMVNGNQLLLYQQTCSSMVGQ
jgi:hypothetical protein